jgi:cold shock CspA family protein
MPKSWTRGTAKEWNSEEGWGIVTSPEVNGDVWAHFSGILGDGYRSLVVGEPVEFRYEERDQDGYQYAALSVKRLGSTP